MNSLKLLLRLFALGAALTAAYYGLFHYKMDVFSLQPDKAAAAEYIYQTPDIIYATTFDGIIRVDSQYYNTASLAPEGKGQNSCPS